MIATDVLLKLHDCISGDLPASEIPTPKQVAEAFQIYTDLLAALELIASKPHTTWCKSRQQGICSCSVGIARAAIEKARKEG